MVTQTQQRRERDASRAYRLSVINTFVLIATFVFGVIWQIYQKHSYEKHFGSIDASLRLLTSTVAPQLLQAVDDNLRAVLSETPIQPTQTSQALAKIETDTASLRKLKAPLPAQQINQTTALLEKVVNQYPDNPSAWGAAAQMVSYRSDLRSEPAERPDCFKTQGAGGWHASDMVMRYHDCTLNLDDVGLFDTIAPRMWQDQANGQRVTARILADVLVTNGTVVYSGAKMIAIQRLSCRDCSFSLRSPETTPPPPGRALSQQLLTADLSNVSLSLPNAEIPQGAIPNPPVS